jgi:GNAT superfamily N-acetyltransferase
MRASGGPGVTAHGSSDLAVVPATPERWTDVERLFGVKGDPARCWCQWFVGAKMRPEDPIRANKAALREQVRSAATAPGLLAYRDEEPVGWCAVGRRTDYPRLRRSAILRGTRPEELEDDSVWSVTCFVVRVGDRRQGVAMALLDGAVGFATAQGAVTVEGYPVDVKVKGSATAAGLYHGTLSMFLRAGFVEVSRPRRERPIVRVEARGGASAVRHRLGSSDGGR